MLKWVIIIIISDTSAADQIQEALDSFDRVICNAYRAHAFEVYSANMV